MKKFIAVLLSVFTIYFTGCSRIGKAGSVSDIDTSDSSADTSIAGVTSVPEVTADVPVVNSVKFSKLIEAETGLASGHVKLTKKRQGYSGQGYMSGFDKSGGNSLEVMAALPSDQHYNITVVVASDAKMNNIITVDGEEAGEFITSGSKKFESITLRNVYITKGLKKIGIKEVTGGIDVDYIYIQNSTDISGMKITPTDKPVNPNADVKTVNTMKYLVNNFGKKIISGQYATPGTNKELDLIYMTTGHYPAIRLGDLAPYTDNKAGNDIKEVETAADWSKRGGMVSYVWHWQAPLDNPDYYTEKTAFDISKAVTKENIADMPLTEIEKLHSDGEISDECLAVVKDIDAVSEKLKYLQSKGVTVLWRPLHEASGGWFWWGAKGADSYKWLWNLLYERQTNYHKLNNLIWVWNAQSPEWYVGDDKCDIISADVYAIKGSQTSSANTFVQLSKISSKKLIALSECASVPSPDLILRDRATWSWFGVWYGEYVMNSDGELSEEYTKKDNLINTYSHEKIITLEQLPDLRVSDK